MTFSLVARCDHTGRLGVAAVTAMPAVGKLVAYAWPRAGAAATQARVNPYLGIDAIALLKEGGSARPTMERLLDGDPAKQSRQFALVDRDGATAAWTGSQCLDWAGHLERDGFSVQGNRLVGPQVLDACAAAYSADEEAPLQDRLLAALEAGVAAGGDRLGENSGTVLVVDREEYPVWDIRVDHHSQPVSELRRLQRIFAEQLVPEIRAMPTRTNPAGEHGEVSV